MEITIATASLYLAFIILILLKFITHPKSEKNMLPEPWRLPIIGHMHHLIVYEETVGLMVNDHVMRTHKGSLHHNRLHGLEVKVFSKCVELRDLMVYGQWSNQYHLWAVVKPISRNLAQLEDCQGSYLSIYDPKINTTMMLSVEKLDWTQLCILLWYKAPTAFSLRLKILGRSLILYPNYTLRFLLFVSLIIPVKDQHYLLVLEQYSIMLAQVTARFSYTLFPLVLLLEAVVECRNNPPLKISDAAAEGVLCCLEHLLIKCHVPSLDQMVGLLKKLTNTTLLSRSQASEEFREGVIRCFKALLNALCLCSNPSCESKQLKSIPRLIDNRYSQSFPVHELDLEECLLAFLRSQSTAVTVGNWLSLLLKQYFHMRIQKRELQMNIEYTTQALGICLHLLENNKSS
ncbi:ARM repeat superfamily protein [Artemisia annua]|uniref:ARM repeat superfamily protein n=1 Tax=Artemisia annua TaxID=35608 RepID=A0A2U1Q8I7_ARTAN|nr:ARM repeat superfamily protein [Artemisia annua]